MVITMAKLRMAHASRLGQNKEERKRERAKVGDNNGQATHGARKHAWRTQAAWANSLAMHVTNRQLATNVHEESNSGHT